jgi:eukaryotic-like serine/threonine-protein kinase
VTPTRSAAKHAETARPIRTEPAASGPRPIAGRYRLGPVLGSGSEAVVYRAADLRTGERVAVKIFRPEASHADERFQREVDIHRRLHHWAVVPVRDHGRIPADDADDAPRRFTVMELVEGRNLRSILYTGPAAPAMTAAWLGSILDALVQVHRKGIVHNDIKPANILVPSAADGSPSLVARLTDFGVATSRRHAPLASTSGTAHYISPEEAFGAKATAASDIYALGLVALECLTGAKAFPGTAVESMVARTLRSPGLPYTLGRRWHALLAAMTAARPEDRPAARQALRQLHRINR